VRRLVNAIFAFLLFLIATVWVGVLVAPGQALLPDVEPLPYQVQGVFPLISANSVGELGATIMLWCIGLRVSGRSTSRWNVFLIALGAITLVAGQYRTGYLATAVALTLLLALRGRRTLAFGMILVVLVGAIWNASSIINAAEPYVLRGQSQEQASKLSGRISFWKEAIPVWQESPVVGKGLLTATRFEVLAPLGYTGTSTIHSTWVEALVGTGVVGVGLLVAFVLLLWRSAIADLLSRTGLVFPGLLIAFTTVRSVTGTTFEIFGITGLMLLVLAYALSDSAAAGTRSLGMR
jgi:O-antigen ligase